MGSENYWVLLGTVSATTSVVVFVLLTLYFDEVRDLKRKVVRYELEGPLIRYILLPVVNCLVGLLLPFFISAGFLSVQYSVAHVAFPALLLLSITLEGSRWWICRETDLSAFVPPLVILAGLTVSVDTFGMTALRTRIHFLDGRLNTPEVSQRIAIAIFIFAFALTIRLIARVDKDNARFRISNAYLKMWDRECTVLRKELKQLVDEHRDAELYITEQDIRNESVNINARHVLDEYRRIIREREQEVEGFSTQLPDRTIRYGMHASMLVTLDRLKTDLGKTYAELRSDVESARRQAQDQEHLEHAGTSPGDKQVSAAGS